MASKSNYWTRSINNRLHLKDVRVEWMQFPSGFDVYWPEAWNLVQKINSGFWYTSYENLVKEPLSLSTLKRETEWLAGIVVYKKQATELLMEFGPSYKEFVDDKILLRSFLEYVSARERYYSDFRNCYTAIDLLPESIDREREKLALFQRKMDRVLAWVQEISIVPSQVIKETDQGDDWEELQDALAKEIEKWELVFAKQQNEELEERKAFVAKKNKTEWLISAKENEELEERKKNKTEWLSAKERCQEDDDEEAWNELYYVRKQKRLNRVGANRRYNVRGR